MTKEFENVGEEEKETRGQWQSIIISNADRFEIAAYTSMRGEIPGTKLAYTLLWYVTDD